MNNLLEATNNTMAMTTTNNNTATLALKSPLKCLQIQQEILMSWQENLWTNRICVGF